MLGSSSSRRLLSALEVAKSEHKNLVLEWETCKFLSARESLNVR